MLKWNLNDIFKDNQSFYKQIDIIKEKIESIKKYEKIELTDEILLELLNKKWEIKELTNNILIYGSLKYYLDFKNEECIKLKDEAEKFNIYVDENLKFIDLKILKIGKDKIDEFLSVNTELQIYNLPINNLFRVQEHIIDDKKVGEYKNIIGESLNSYNDLLHNINYGNIEVDGKQIELNTSNYGKYISARNRDVRKHAYLQVNKCFKEKEEDFTSILNTIYNARIEMAKLERYESVLEKVLFEENIDSKIVDSLIQAVNENLSIIQEYLNLKAEILKIDEPHLYDFGVPLDKDIKIKYSLEDAINIIKNALKPLGEEYLKIVDKLLDGHIDAELDEKKHQSITFSWNTYSFMNFRGAYVDLKNMIHEIGHIVNYSLSKENQPYIYEDSTVFVGEVASIVNEILLVKYLYENAKTEEEKIFYLSKEIENYFTTLYKQTMYTEFENSLYKKRENFTLTSNIINDTYREIIKKYYGNDVVYDDVSDIEWTRLGHLYRWSYYPYKYATGLIMASIVVNSITEENTLTAQQYLKFLSSGSNNYSLELLKLLNIYLTNQDIINSGFNVLKEDIKRFSKIIQK